MSVLPCVTYAKTAKPIYAPSDGGGITQDLAVSFLGVRSNPISQASPFSVVGVINFPEGMLTTRMNGVLNIINSTTTITGSLYLTSNASGLNDGFGTIINVSLANGNNVIQMDSVIWNSLYNQSLLYVVVQGTGTIPSVNLINLSYSQSSVAYGSQYTNSSWTNIVGGGCVGIAN